MVPLGRSLLAAVVGALVTNCTPWLVALSLGVPRAGAAWGWNLPQPAQCTAPPISGGACREGTVLPAGASCTVECEAGLTFPCEPPRCPPSDGTFQNDLNGEFDWWNFCGLGSTCVNAPLVLAGEFACGEESVATATNCSTVRFNVTSSFEDPPQWDWAIAVIFVSMLAIVAVAAASQLCLPVESNLHALWCNAPRPFEAWTRAGLMGLLIFACVLAFVVIALRASPAGGDPWGTRTQALADAFGLMAALCLPLPVLWSYMRMGVHHLFGMSLESAWRVHIAMGAVFLGLVTLHGILELTWEDSSRRWELIQENSQLLAGLVAVGLFYCAVLAADVHILCPNLPYGYSIFKLTHALVLPAYVLAIYHMQETVRLKAYKFDATTWSDGEFNVLMLWCIVVISLWALQRLYSILSFMILKPSLIAAEATPDGHVFLTVKRNGFVNEPGQWAHVYVGWDPVAHPFTVVPHPEVEDWMHFFIRATGTFTSKLHEQCQSQHSLPSMRFSGPYGRPLFSRNSDMTYLRAICFVCGGVGITPALSLAEAAQRSGKLVYLYWSLRSPAMLRKCIPLLTRFQCHGGQRGLHIVITGHKEEFRDTCGIVLHTQRQPLKDWLEEKGEELVEQGIRHAGLFMCGPPGLSEEAIGAARSEIGGVHWHLHSEEFRFLPFTRACVQKLRKHRDSAVRKSQQSRSTEANSGASSEPNARLIGSRADSTANEAVQSS